MRMPAIRWRALKSCSKSVLFKRHVRASFQKLITFAPERLYKPLLRTARQFVGKRSGTPCEGPHVRKTRKPFELKAGPRDPRRPRACPTKAAKVQAQVSYKRAGILFGDGGGCAQRLRGVQRPVWVAQKLARQQHDVRLPGAHDCARLMRLGDHPHRSREDAGLVPDALGEGRLVGRSDLDLGMRHDSAKIQIGPRSEEHTSELQSLRHLV